MLWIACTSINLIILKIIRRNEKYEDPWKNQRWIIFHLMENGNGQRKVVFVHTEASTDNAVFPRVYSCSFNLCRCWISGRKCTTVLSFSRKMEDRGNNKRWRKDYASTQIKEIALTANDIIRPKRKENKYSFFFSLSPRNTWKYIKLLLTHFEQWNKVFLQIFLIKKKYILRIWKYFISETKWIFNL